MKNSIIKYDNSQLQLHLPQKRGSMFKSQFCGIFKFIISDHDLRIISTLRVAAKRYPGTRRYISQQEYATLFSRYMQCGTQLCMKAAMQCGNPR